MAEKKPKAKTTYAVFVVTTVVYGGDDVEVWRPVGVMDAHGALAAISSVAAGPGDYRAVPLSNITEQALAHEEPQPPKLVPVAKEQLTLADVEVGPDGFPVGPSSTNATNADVGSVAAGIEEDGA